MRVAPILIITAGLGLSVTLWGAAHVAQAGGESSITILGSPKTSATQVAPLLDPPPVMKPGMLPKFRQGQAPDQSDDPSDTESPEPDSETTPTSPTEMPRVGPWE